MGDHHEEELPHQAPWVMWLTLGAVTAFLTLFFTVKFLTA